MPFLIGLLLVLLVLLIAFWIIGHLVGLVVALVIAGLIGLLAERIVPGRIPYGLLGAVVAGLLGTWLGALLLGHLGPAIAGIAIIPATVGAIIVVAAAKLVFRATQPNSRRLGPPMQRGRLR
ncbi:MAG TPA: GlsB/YeaQ/YmgE family stress response membrane protein [Thermomicrobiaceae bacterium]|nr:GlsB/YeaQ/YmgE family stress response membrane protein [Thermomicrobiaceae bacterium]